MAARCVARQTDVGVATKQTGQLADHSLDAVIENAVVLDDQERSLRRNAFLPEPVMRGETADLAGHKRPEEQRIDLKEALEGRKVVILSVHGRDERPLQSELPKLRLDVLLSIERTVEIDNANIQADVLPGTIGDRPEMTRDRPK
jgi:hypothetical protein